MSGLAGLVGINETNHIQDVLPALLKPLHWRDDDEARTYTESRFGMGLVEGMNKSEPLMAAGNGIQLGVFGRIVQDECFEASLRSTPGTLPNDTLAEKLLSLYQFFGPRAFGELNGQYIVVVWDSVSRVLRVINDRGGIQPFYYWQNGNVLAFGTSMKSIAQHPNFSRQINPQALFDLLATGQMLGERTLFEGVYALPPASTLTFSQGHLTVSNYWQPPLYQPSERTIPMNGAIECLSSLITAAAHRQTSPESCLLLTGGLDSRWLAGSLVMAYGAEDVYANTIGHKQARDTELARKIAAKLGIEHQLIPVNPSFLADNAEECIRRTEGNMNISAGWILTELPFIRSGQVRQVVTGVGAEMISGRHWLAETDEKEPEQALHRITSQHWNFARAAALMRAPLQENAPQASLELLRQCMHNAPSTDPHSRYDYLHMVQHRRHPTGNLLQADVEVAEPFFDHNLLDFSLSLPPLLRTHIYKAALVKTFPSLASIEATEQCRSVEDDLKNRPNLLRQAEKSLYRLSRRLNMPLYNGAPVGDAPWNTIYHNHWLRTVTQNYVRALFNKLSLLENWIDVPAARRLLEEHLAGRQNAYAMISALMTAVLWVEYMLE